MGKKPKIAVTCSFEEKSGYHKIRKSYVEALVNSGGVPYVLPHFSDSNLQAEEILRDVDGLVLSGGTDVDPKWFDQEPRYNLLEIVPHRDSLEIELAREARKADLPIIGICRGLQVINIAAGGEIYQDIENQVENTLRHSQDAPRWHPTHSIDVRSSSLLGQILGEEHITVNSFHHQSVREVADGFQICATSSDGIIEAIEHEGGYQLGVQWHPESMWKKHPIHQKLFEWLVRISKE